jgi:hypothetical protein
LALCRDVEVTQEMRYFIFVSIYNAATAKRYLSVIEVYSTGGLTLTGKLTLLHEYTNNEIKQNFYRMARKTNGQYVLYYS